MNLSKKAMDHLVTTTKWKSADGPILIKDMTTDHLLNAYAYFRRTGLGEAFYCCFTRTEWLSLFEHELNRRRDSSQVAQLQQERETILNRLQQIRADLEIFQEIEAQQLSDLRKVEHGLCNLSPELAGLCMA